MLLTILLIIGIIIFGILILRNGNGTTPQVGTIPNIPANNNATEVLITEARVATSTTPVRPFNTINSETIQQETAVAANLLCGPPEVCPSVPIPTNFDGRQVWQGFLTLPLNQGTCGSCWSFGVATAFADRIRLFAREGRHNIRLNLNTQDEFRTFYEEEVLERTDNRLLVNQIPYSFYDFTMPDVTSPYFVAGCNVCELTFQLDKEVRDLFNRRSICAQCCSGGVIQYALVFMLLNGVIAMGCDPEPEVYTCSNFAGCPRFYPQRVYKVSLYLNELKPEYPDRARYLQENEQAIQRELLTNGPVPTSMDVFENLQTWRGDVVYDLLQGNNIGGHTVVIVGWGVGPNAIGEMRPYWLIRNSWGIEWGDQGYFRLLRGQNFCRAEQFCWAVKPFEVYDLTRETVDPNTPRPPVPALCSVPGGGVVNPITQTVV